MQPFLVLLIMITVLFAPDSSAAANKKYFSLMAGPSFRTDADSSFSGSRVAGNPGGEQDVDIGAVGGVAAGMYLPDHLRVEAELALRNNEVGEPLPGFQDWNVGAVTLMVNGYYDIPLHHAIQPFVGAGMGLGLATSSLEDNFGFSDTDTETVFTYQLMGGAQYRHNDRLTFFTAYRYFATTDPDFQFGGVRAATQINSHDWIFGVRFDFE
ncbi:outer membrane protein [Nitrospina watsonii]|uniref:Surface antigen msp4 family protein n=1 Tax=Nitrospina watsonii TaxID=1323948 RepID=A0ABM9HGE1_9BACT|nr:outer membrane beta-barrel protein [Nitrospina watsonii]CAI2719117.1 Putative Surface antigen msp4 family protein [Nitrospina watsonii]